MFQTKTCFIPKKEDSEINTDTPDTIAESKQSSRKSSISIKSKDSDSDHDTNNLEVWHSYLVQNGSIFGTYYFQCLNCKACKCLMKWKDVDAFHHKQSII